LKGRGDIGVRALPVNRNVGKTGLFLMRYYDTAHASPDQSGKRLHSEPGQVPS
jgi:hypothetical protein